MIVKNNKIPRAFRLFPGLTVILIDDRLLYAVKRHKPQQTNHRRGHHMNTGGFQRLKKPRSQAHGATVFVPSQLSTTGGKTNYARFSMQRRQEISTQCFSSTFPSR